MDDYQTHRHAAFAPYVSKQGCGIEIGPSYRPTFPKSAGFAVTVIDHCSTEDLIAKYEADLNVPRELVRQIEAVDIVWTEGSYRALPGLAGAVDYIAACHVIEHVTDVCGFLGDCAALLRERGLLLLAIPDRRCVLDCYRPASTLGDVLLAHLEPAAYDRKSQLDEVWYGALLDGGGAWSMEHLHHATGLGRVPVPQHGVDVARHIWDLSVASAEAGAKSGGYRDAHRWVFDPANFEEIVRFLCVQAKTELVLESMPAGYGCEFYAVLRKVSGGAAGDTSGLEDCRHRTLRARTVGFEMQ